MLHRSRDFLFQKNFTAKAVWLAAAIVLIFVSHLPAMEQVTVSKEGQSIRLEGKSLFEASDGGRLFLDRLGEIHILDPTDQSDYKKDSNPFKPYSSEEMNARIFAKLPKGFDVHETAHYLIYYDTSRAYAQWCGALFERLYRAFTNFWKQRGLKVAEPEFPLVAIVFSDRQSFCEFSKGELGDASKSVIGYYSIKKNWMVMYDLTGLSTFDRDTRIRTSAQINKILSQPQGASIVSTIVHEATHQIAYNCGMHIRYAETPLWLAEGIAQYFETPDLASAKGWRSIGEVNWPRLDRFRKYQEYRKADSLKQLFIDDDRLRESKTALDAYAESWALTYFLIRKRGKQYIEYMRRIGERKQGAEKMTPEQRLEELQEVFGDLNRLHYDFIRYIDKVQ